MRSRLFAMLFTLSSVVPAHQASGDHQEMRPVMAIEGLLFNKAYIRLMNQGRTLECMPRTLPP